MEKVPDTAAMVMLVEAVDEVVMPEQEPLLPPPPSLHVKGDGAVLGVLKMDQKMIPVTATGVEVKVPGAMMTWNGDGYACMPMGTGVRATATWTPPRIVSTPVKSYTWATELVANWLLNVLTRKVALRLVMASKVVWTEPGAEATVIVMVAI
jgi:hypothetical protein